MPLNFVIENFETTIYLDVSGTMLGESFFIDASAHATIEVDLNKVRSAFQFQSDSSDVLNSPDDDVKFYLKESDFWSAGFRYNAADAQLLSTGGTTGPIAVGFPPNKSMVCHDFVRYLADKLFNTHHGVDLLDNEAELLENIRLKATKVWDNMNTVVDQYKDDNITLTNQDANGDYYTTNIDTDSIVRKLYEQMIYTLAGKERFKGPIITGVRQDLPFEVDDTIEIKLIINPQPDQHTLTNVSVLGPRTYKIIYVLKSIPVGPARDNPEGSNYYSYI